MVGLSIVLESTNNTLSDGLISPKPHHIVNKSAVVVTAIASDLCRVRYRSESGFLEYCFLCRRKLLADKDIFMYKGDTAFCSVECRSKKMIMDEEESLRTENYSFMASKTTNSDSLASSSPSSSGGHRRHCRDPRNRAGGFAY